MKKGDSTDLGVPHLPTSARDPFTLMMESAARKALPEAPTSGKNNSQTDMDRLIGDVISLLRSKGLGFPADSDGLYVIRSVARALWCSDNCHQTLANAAIHKSVPSLSSTWSAFTGYFDPEARKEKKRNLEERPLRDNANILIGLLGKPVLASASWKEFRDDVEV